MRSCARVGPRGTHRQSERAKDEASEQEPENEKQQRIGEIDDVARDDPAGRPEEDESKGCDPV